MTRYQAAEWLYEYRDRPVFSVRIGMCSPEVEDVDLETAMNAFDRCGRFRRKDNMEYTHIYCSEIVEKSLAKNLENALKLFDMGSYPKETK